MAPTRRAGKPARSPSRFTLDDMVPPSLHFPMSQPDNDNPSVQHHRASYHRGSDERTRSVPHIVWTAGFWSNSSRRRSMRAAYRLTKPLFTEHPAMPGTARSLGRERYRGTIAPPPPVEHLEPEAREQVAELLGELAAELDQTEPSPTRKIWPKAPPNWCVPSRTNMNPE